MGNAAIGNGGAGLSTATKTLLDLMIAAGVPVPGTDLDDSAADIDPWTDKASLYVLPAATLTTNRSRALVAATGAPDGYRVTVVRRDRTANSFTVTDKASGATLFASGASPTADYAYDVVWNTANWVYGTCTIVQPLP